MLCRNTKHNLGCLLNEIYIYIRKLNMQYQIKNMYFIIYIHLSKVINIVIQFQSMETEWKMPSQQIRNKTW